MGNSKYPFGRSQFGEGGLQDMVISGLTVQSPKTATFYIHGLGGCLDDWPHLKDSICHHMPMIRVSCFGISNPVSAVGLATFGDVWACLQNSRQSISTVADILRLESFNIDPQLGRIHCLPHGPE
jgi:hypothetical protein